MPRISTTVTTEQREALQRIADSRDMTMAELIRFGLDAIARRDNIRIFPTEAEIALAKRQAHQVMCKHTRTIFFSMPKTDDVYSTYYVAAERCLDCGMVRG